MAFFETTFGAILVGLGGQGACTLGLFVWDKRWKYDALSLNAFKGTLASIFLMLLVLTFSSLSIFLDSNAEVGWVILTSFLGIVIADTWWLQALERLGARRMISIDVIKPTVAIIFGATILKDEVTVLAVTGMLVTSIGIWAVNFERISRDEPDNEEIIETTDDNPFSVIGIAASSESELAAKVTVTMTDDSPPLTLNDCNSGNSSRVPTPPPFFTSSGVATSSSEFMDGDSSLRKNYLVDPSHSHPMRVKGSKSQCRDISTCQSLGTADLEGYGYALGNVLLDVYAACLLVERHKKLAILNINLLRFGFASVVLILVLSAKIMWRQRFLRPFEEQLMSRHDWCAVALGIVFVTVITPIATVHTYFTLPLGTAITISSTGPLWSLPTAKLHGEKISRFAIVGAVLSTGGVAMLACG